MENQKNGKITVVYPITDLARDGAQRQLFELVKGLDKNRFCPYILTLNSGRSMEDDFNRIPGAEVISLEKQGRYDFWCLQRAYNVLRRLKADVVQPFLTPATFFSLLPAIWCRVPVIIVTERSGKRMDTGAGFRYYVKIEDFFSRFADWAIPNSESGKQYLLERGMNSERVKVIFNGIDFSRLNSDPQKVLQFKKDYHITPENQIVGMMARFFPIKNHSFFMQMAAIINQFQPSTRFVLLGDGPLRSEMENLSQRSGLSEKMIFLGEKPDIGTYLAAFDVAVMTSVSEGCCNSILEYMALGKPVVATDVGGNHEIIHRGENGLLIPPGKPQAMAEAVLSLLKDTEQSGSLAHKAKEFAVSRFSLQRMIEEYENLYQDTLSKKLSLNAQK